MKVLDGDGSAFYVDAEGAGSVGDPAKLLRVLEGGYRQIQVEITRPANTTAYSANDAVADNAPSITTHVLAGAARKVGGTGSIVRASVATDKIDSTMALFMVVYNAAPAGGFTADNAAFSFKYADIGKKVGIIPFPAVAVAAAGGAGCAPYARVDGLNIPFKTVAVDDLYFELYQKGTPTPASGQKFYFDIGVIQD
jgi:hypothetical protein